MKKTNKTQSAPKTVSADTKKANLALKPFGPNITMDDLRNALRIPDYHKSQSTCLTSLLRPSASAQETT